MMEQHQLQFFETHISQPSIDVSIIWNHRKTNINSTQGISYSQLLPLALTKFNKAFGQLRASRQSQQVIGFSHKPVDLLLDYQMSIGVGTVQKSITLIPFFKNNQTGILKYEVYKCLAVGGFSKVYLVRSHHDGQFYVMKTMTRTKSQNQEDPDLSVIENEKNINTLVGDHPFIVKFHDSFQTDHFAFFIFEYCPGGQLFYNLKKIKRMTQDQARFYFVEILYAFDHLHQNGILYRDLKPENILIAADGHVKLADFGLSKTGVDNDTLSYSYCGSAQYMAPQMILRTGHTFSFDFYTLGAMLYQLVVGIPPFYSQNQEINRFGILNEDVMFPSDLQLSNDLKNILRGLLNKNNKLRLGCLKGVKEIRCHPWVGMLSPKNILERKLVPPFLPDLSQLNFDQSEIGKDEGQFTRKLRKQIQVLNRSIETKKFSKHKLFINRSQIRNQLQGKQNATLSRHLSPYLQKMALTNSTKLKIYRNIEPISRKKQRLDDDQQNIKQTDHNKQNRTFEISRLTKVYISTLNKRKDFSPKQLLKNNDAYSKHNGSVQRLIRIIPNAEMKSTSVWK